MKDELLKEIVPINFKGKEISVYEEAHRLLVKGVET